MTFILAKELTEAAIKDALLKRRTIAYSAGYLIGEEKWLTEFLNAAIDCRLIKVDEKSGTRRFQITNTTSLTYRLNNGGKFVHELEPFQAVTIALGKDKETGKYLAPTFTVDNMWHIDYQHPTITLEIDK